MRSDVGIVVASLIAATAAWTLFTSLAPPRPSLARTVRRLRAESVEVGDAPSISSGVVERVGRCVMRRPALGGRIASARSLRLVSRSPERHAGELVLATLAGFVLPSALVALLVASGAVGLGFGPTMPLAVSALAAVLCPLAVHVSMVERAKQVEVDVRHQLSAYLDMVTMLLAGNTGHEGALEQAARSGDGLLFRELRRRMREVGATGDSLVRALEIVGDDLGLVELQQVAATATLSASEGAPVARTLAAKCATLRSTIASDQEAAARVRNDKITPPLVGMALLFMALIIYPALDLS